MRLQSQVQYAGLTQGHAGDVTATGPARERDISVSIGGHIHKPAIRADALTLKSCRCDHFVLAFLAPDGKRAAMQARLRHGREHEGHRCYPRTVRTDSVQWPVA